MKAPKLDALMQAQIAGSAATMAEFLLRDVDPPHWPEAKQALVAAIRTPDVRARLTSQGAEVVTMTPAETDRFFAAERARWLQVVQAAQVRLD